MFASKSKQNVQHTKIFVDIHFWIILFDFTAAPDDNRPIDCAVEEWGAWSACSKSCGTGRQVRRRKVKHRRKNKGARCPPLKDARQCSAGSKCRKLFRTRYGQSVQVMSFAEYTASGLSQAANENVT